MFQAFTRTRQQDSTARAVDVPCNGTLRLPPGKGGTLVRVVRGTVVVTREGDGEDHVLTAGLELRLPRAGLAVAWALQDSRLLIRWERRGAAVACPGTPPPRSAPC